MDRYVIVFSDKDTDRCFGPMACGEACELLGGIIFSRTGGTKTAPPESTTDLEIAEHLIEFQRLTIDNLETNKQLLEEAGTAMLKNVEELRKEHHKNAVEQAKAMRAMFMAKMEAEEALQMLKATINHVF